MTAIEIDNAIRVADWLYERLRIKYNTAIAQLALLEGKHPDMDLSEAKSTLSGSMFAHHRKVEKHKRLLEEAREDL